MAARRSGPRATGPTISVRAASRVRWTIGAESAGALRPIRIIPPPSGKGQRRPEGLTCSPTCSHCQPWRGLLLSGHAPPVTAPPTPVRSRRCGGDPGAPRLPPPARRRRAPAGAGRRRRPHPGDRPRAAPPGPARRGVGRAAGPAAIRADASLGLRAGDPRARAERVLERRRRPPWPRRTPAVPGHPPKSAGSLEGSHRPVIAGDPSGPSRGPRVGGRSVPRSTYRGRGDSGRPVRENERGAWQG